MTKDTTKALEPLAATIMEHAEVLRRGTKMLIAYAGDKKRKMNTAGITADAWAAAHLGNDAAAGGEGIRGGTHQ